MKKDRNTFFTSSGYYNQTNIPGPMVANQPFPMQPNYNMTQPQMQNFKDDYSDIESRISKLERNINRIDARVSKLENLNTYSIDEIDNSTNMYMV